jgi:hypothetical protein
MPRTATIISLAICAGFACIASETMAQPFSDGTFNLSDYTIQTFTQTGTVSITQLTSGGNPGDALSVAYSTPPVASGDDVSANYIVNNTFTFNPAGTGGNIALSFALDKSFDVETPLGVGFANGQSFLVEQGGNLYRDGTTLPSASGFQTANLPDVGAASFDLITNLASGAIDSTKHPNFSSGTMEFGFTSSLTDPLSVPVQVQLEYDNFDVSVVPTTAVPEPEDAAWMLAGMIAVGVARRMRRQQ